MKKLSRYINRKTWIDNHLPLKDIKFFCSFIKSKDYLIKQKSLEKISKYAIDTIRNDIKELLNIYQDCFKIINQLEDYPTIINISFINYLRNNRKSTLIIYCADKLGEVLVKFINDFNQKTNHQIKVLCFFDNDPHKINTSFCGVEIQKPSLELAAQVDKVVVISGWREMVLEELLQLGISHEKIIVL